MKHNRRAHLDFIMTRHISFFLFKLLFFSFVFSLHFFSFSETLILQASDGHSSYRRMQAFLGSIEVLTREFKSRHPKGNVLIIINGDYSSLLHLTEADSGDFGYEILSQLARKYLVLFTFGNHDSFNWNDSQVFLRQMEMLKKAGVQLLVANVAFEPGYENIFSPFLDLSLSGKKVRFVGFTLPYKESFRFLYPDFGPQVISDVFPIGPKAAQIMEEADQDPEIAKVVFSMHLGHTKVRKALSEIPAKHRNKLNLIFAGHDHDEFFGLIRSTTHLVDSNAFFEFSAVTLDDQLKVAGREFYNVTRQKGLSQRVKPGSLEFHLMRRVQTFIASGKQRRAGVFNYEFEAGTPPLEAGLEDLNIQERSMAAEPERPAAVFFDSPPERENRRRGDPPHMRKPGCQPYLF